MDEMAGLDIEISQRFRRLRNNAILVGGFIEEDYQSTVARFQNYFRASANHLSVDFQEIMGQDYWEVAQRLRNINDLFVYNMDLFGLGTNPDIATQMMGVLRAAQN